MLQSEIAIILMVVYIIIFSQYTGINSCNTRKSGCSYSSNSTDVYYAVIHLLPNLCFFFTQVH